MGRVDPRAEGYWKEVMFLKVAVLDLEGFFCLKLRLHKYILYDLYGNWLWACFYSPLPHFGNGS